MRRFRGNASRARAPQGHPSPYTTSRASISRTGNGQPGSTGQSAPGPCQHRVWADGQDITLTYQEFELLAFLSAHPATVFSRADLVEHVWHQGVQGEHDQRPVTADSRIVDVHISRLRQKLGPRHGQCLVTEYRVGYRFRPAAP